jgi:hypothetical protein
MGIRSEIGPKCNRRRRPNQGRLASQLSGLESADTIEPISVMVSSVLGSFRTIWAAFDRTMVVYWSWDPKL